MPVPAQTKKPCLVMLVPHEPTLDPRIDYTASSLSAEYDVTVVAAVRPHEERPAENLPRAPTYKTVRLSLGKPRELPMLHAFLLLCFGWRPRSGLGSYLPWLLATLALAAFVASRILIRLAWRAVTPLLRPLSAIKRLISPERPLVAEVTSKLQRLQRGVSITRFVSHFTLQVNAVLLRYVQDSVLRPDVVYCHDLYTLQAGSILKRRFGCALVYDSHEFYPFVFGDWPGRFVVGLYESVLLRNVDLYITVSPQLAEALRNYYSVPHVEAIPNVEPRPIHPVRPLLTNLSELAKGRLRVLYQGSFAQGRGLEEVLTEWDSVDPAKAVLFLRGPRTPSLAELETIAGNLGLLGKSVFVLEPVLECDLISGAAEADVGLVPYKAESPAYRYACPNKLSQYVHAGLTILTNRIPYVEQVINDYGIGLCYDVKRPGSFAAAVNVLASDTRLMQQYKDASRRASETEYNWERWEPALLELVRATLSRGTPAYSNNG